MDMVLHQRLNSVTFAIRELKILLAEAPSIRQYVDSKADQLRGMDKLIGAMKSIGEHVGSLIEMRKLTHETLQETEWKLWNYKRWIRWFDRTVEVGVQWYARTSCQILASDVIQALPTELLERIFDSLLDDAAQELLRSHFNHALRLLCHRQTEEIGLMNLLSGVTSEDLEPLPFFFKVEFVGRDMAAGIAKRASELISRTSITAMGIPDILTTDFSQFRLLGLPWHAFVQKVEIMVRFPEITGAYIQNGADLEGTRHGNCLTAAKRARSFLAEKLRPVARKGSTVVLLVGNEHRYRSSDGSRWKPVFYEIIVDGLKDELEGLKFTNLDVERVSLAGSHLTMRSRGTPRTSPVTYSDWIGVSPPV